MRKKVLLLVSEKQILDILTFAAGREGYEIIRSVNGAEGPELAACQKPDIIVLNLLPPMDSFETCRRLRDHGATVPIIILASSAEANETESFRELNAGIVRKPFAMKELLLQISDTLRFEGDGFVDEHIDSSPQRHLGRIIIDLEKVLVTKDGTALALSKQEYDVLELLSSEPGRVFSREELLNRVWNYTAYLGDSRNADTAVRRLREKIEDDPAHPNIILTRRGRGYVFVQQ
ncbi:MAG: response regulator transcription factor [Oscillospiraceae bacterium]|nr:response regulator transcription factor [Oscillospiraceae bacterium]